MRAVRIHAHGGPESLRVEEIPVPEPGAGEVRVRLLASGLNHLDLWVRKGVEGHSFPLPLTPGSDGAGVVEVLGPGIRRARIGDRVALHPAVSCGICDACVGGRDHHCLQYRILGEHRDGTQAEAVVVPEANLLPMPEALGFVEAAAIPLAFLTAWTMLVDRARLESGETLLVIAGGSGVGSAAIRIGRLLGARVLATAGGRTKVERCQAIGAEAAFDHSAPGFARSVKQATGGRGADVVVEHVGHATWDESLRSLARGGRLVTCGATTGEKVEVNLRHLFFKNQAVMGSTMGSLASMRRIWGEVGRGRLEPVVDRTFRLDELAEAHAYISGRSAFGKVVLTLDG